MKVIISFFIAMLFCADISAQTAGAAHPAIPADAKIEARIQEWLKKMTLDEKVGQMCQITIDAITDYPKSQATGKFVINKAMFDTIFGKYKVGSMLNVPLNEAQTKEVYYDLIKEIQDYSMKHIGIPCLYGIDQIHGSTFVLDGTLLPQNINLAASFNLAYARKAGEITAYETRAASVPWSFSPVVDLGRDPRWPRMWENFGEDCLVNSLFGVEVVKGMQGNDLNNVGTENVAASMKHYMGYGVPRSGKDRTPSNITPSEMREKHFAPYLATVRAGALSVMVNSGSNNGMPFHANKEYLTGWLKDDLNWDGLIVTDWADINNLFERDHIAGSKKEAIEIGINAGIDISMVPYDPSFCTDLKALVEEGRVPMSRIDDAVARILRLKYRLGLFDKPYVSPKNYKDFGSQKFADVALQAALESEVLLKNENNMLPLKEGVKILLAGPNANSIRSLNGGWSYTWQGNKADELGKNHNTIYEALCNRFGKENVVLDEGVSYAQPKIDNWWEEVKGNIDAVAEKAKSVDVVIACIGENSYCETPGNIDDITLSENQSELVKKLAATGKPIVLVLNEGRPRIIHELVPLAKAVVDVLLPGNYGGDALAKLLAGDENFSAKLPFTYPKYVNALVTYDYKPCENLNQQMEGNYNYDAKMSIQWPFGYGLSYTEYKYDNMKINKSHFAHCDDITVSVDVANTGNRKGKEAVLLYSKDVTASSTPDNIRLRAFEKIELAPGEKRTVSFTIPASDLAFVGYDGKWRLEKGEFKFKCGDNWVDAYCEDTKVWDTPNR